MGITSGFFDAVYNDGKYDRAYDASDFSQYFSMFVGNGVFANPTSTLQVMANSDPNMGVSVKPGIGWINGYYVKNDSEYPLTIAPADGTQNRIDAIVLRWSKEDRDIKLLVKQGSLGSIAAAPTPQRDDTVHELVLAHVRVDRGVSEITQSEITDKRAVKDLCGWVAGIIDQIDATDLFVQFENEFRTWFEDIQAQLSGDVAANLQRQITQNANDIDSLEEKVGKIEPVGHIKSTVQSSLGENWLLCNGERIESGSYPELEDIISKLGVKSTFGKESKYDSKFYIPQNSDERNRLCFCKSDKNIVFTMATRMTSSSNVLNMYYIGNMSKIPNGESPNIIKLFDLSSDDGRGILISSLSYVNGIFFCIYTTSTTGQVKIKYCRESDGIESGKWKDLQGLSFSNEIYSITKILFFDNKYFFVIQYNSSGNDKIQLCYTEQSLSAGFTKVAISTEIPLVFQNVDLIQLESELVLFGTSQYADDRTVCIYNSAEPINPSSWFLTKLTTLVDGVGKNELPAKITLSEKTFNHVFENSYGDIFVSVDAYMFSTEFSELVAVPAIITCSHDVDYKQSSSWKIHIKKSEIKSSTGKFRDETNGIVYTFGNLVTQNEEKDGKIYLSAFGNNNKSICFLTFDCGKNTWEPVVSISTNSNNDVVYTSDLMICPYDVFIAFNGHADNYYYYKVAIDGKYLPLIDVDKGNAFIKAKSEVI